MKNNWSKIIIALILSASVMLMPAASVLIIGNNTNHLSMAATYDTTYDTTLSDGYYLPDDFSYSGGTGKVTITCKKVIVTAGKTYAKISFSSGSYTKITANGITYKPETDSPSGTSVFILPVKLNEENLITGTTVAMSEPHDIDYTLSVKLDEPEVSSSEPATDNAVTIADGLYKPDSFSFTGGTGKVKISCSKLQVSNSKAFATIVFSSPYYTQMKTGGYIYKAKIDSDKKTSTFVIPAAVNKATHITATTTAMSAPHDVDYDLTIAATSSSEIITDDSDNDDSKSNGADVDITKTQKLKAGVYKVITATDDRMFYIQEDDQGRKLSLLTIDKSGMEATITLTGQGYDYLYMGTIEEAGKASKSSLSKFKSTKGYYSYTLKIPKLDTKLTISAHSKRLNKWYQHTIILYSSGAVKSSRNAAITPDKANNTSKTSGTQSEFKNDNKSDHVSKSKADASGSTTAADNSVDLKDGVYTPNAFSWSGGSGRLAYIRCDKITVTGGKAYATIVFSSSSYDSLKASGRTYSNSGSALSTFVIPVKLNSNNTIIGRTTAMSSAHWIDYTIFISMDTSASKTGKTTASKKPSSNKLTNKAPELTGLKYKSAVKIKYSKFLRIFNYEKGIKMIQIKISDSAYKTTADTPTTDGSDVEYDEEGKPIARSQTEITDSLYHNNVIDYLVVPEGTELPAGLDKEYIIIYSPVSSAFVSSDSAADILKKSGLSSSVSDFSTDTEINYRDMIKKHTDLAILSSDVMPAMTDTSILTTLFSSDENKYNCVNNNFSLEVSDAYHWTSPKGLIINTKASSKEKAAANTDIKDLESIEEHFTTLNVPVIIDRSADEKDPKAVCEWENVYNIIFSNTGKGRK